MGREISQERYLGEAREMIHVKGPSKVVSVNAMLIYIWQPDELSGRMFGFQTITLFNGFAFKVKANPKRQRLCPVQISRRGTLDRGMKR
jgi:hypothetical protein